ncbi:DNA-formamidopyrimidine glycosylase family protein [Mesobacillus stamsii]|uniref:Formamidopyrimidine-DNA glycosylase n=1 Tax=Mesobacillus stamsii TaxID=225347 RepID=A0ABU0G0J6_9BACI|nr:DNA-formamidopyrimidine glycosylase family protein [Mesobacillus stamsii]MDQ0415590.1 formamidopyrimidine-DNA glycosylase [Mesobacillus stamsii]
MMPELPEMETYKTLLGSLIGGQKITKVEIGREKSINLPVDQFSMEISNQAIKTIKGHRDRYLVPPFCYNWYGWVVTYKVDGVWVSGGWVV